MDAISPIADISSSLPTGGASFALSGKLNPAAFGDIDKTAQDFEAMFATQMLQPMFEGLGVDPTFGGGHGEEVMRSFLLQEYGKIIAQTGKLGIGRQVKTEMLRAQEAAHSRNAKQPSAAAARAAQNAYSDAEAGGATHAAY